MISTKDLRAIAHTFKWHDFPQSGREFDDFRSLRATTWRFCSSSRESGNESRPSELVDLIVKSIGRKSFVELARAEPIPTNDPNLKSLLAEFPVDDGEPERRMRNVELFGLEMEEAIILRAKRPVAKKPARRVLQRAS
jgi:hypothetical protein